MLRAYRQAIDSHARLVVRGLWPEALKLKVDPNRLQQVTDEDAVLPAGQAVINYWSKRTIKR